MIAFSQAFEWKQNGAICDPQKHPEIYCTCNQKFPAHMLADGILQCILVYLLILGAVLMVCGPECRGAGQGVLVSAICSVRLPVQGVQIAMWVYMFQSDKACGPSLWAFGIFFIILASCQLAASKTRTS